MYRFSRAIYREIASDIIEPEHAANPQANHERVLRLVEATIERMATDRHYFARPAKTLFRDVRVYVPLNAQVRVLHVIERYLAYADEFMRGQPQNGYDLAGNPLQCRASTRKGTQCQRVPLAHNGYCTSHQHLAETEEVGPGLEIAA
ncbi:MAG: hypothetical protein WAL22_14235 [Solirubrobacteraceae bacterium]